jgi:hypothetical protein
MQCVYYTPEIIASMHINVFESSPTIAEQLYFFQYTFVEIFSSLWAT